MAGAVAAVVSGVPSTLMTRGDALAATRAAGTLLPGRRDRPGVFAGLAAHILVSAFWTAVNRRRRLGAIGGAVAGLVIAGLDLGIAAKAFPAIDALPRFPQVCDHVVFGAVAGALLPSTRDGHGTTSTTSPGCSVL